MLGAEIHCQLLQLAPWIISLQSSFREFRPSETHRNWGKGLPVAPINADQAGARRAGQGRACGERSERTLDAPKRSRKMLRRSDGTLPSRVYLRRALD